MSNIDRHTRENPQSPPRRPAYAGTNWLNLIIDAATAWWSRAAGRTNGAASGEKS